MVISRTVRSTRVLLILLIECDKGKYGKDCAEFCSIFCSNGSCDSFNGTCDGGCIDGYKPPNCVEECDHAFYGPNCSLPCSDRCVNGTCNAANGNCEACIPGYVGPTCEVCPKTSYGVDCRQKCSINCLDQDCDHISGNCHGCNPGKQGDLCSKDCDSGKYGNKCEETCSKNCAGQVGCNPQNGTCLEGCHPGYRDSLCTEPCYATTYGAHCRLNCSENCITDVNREPSVCHHKTGSCLLGCKSGFEGPTCAKVVHDEDAIGVIVGPILVLLLLGVIAIIGFFVWRRHKIPNSNKLLDNGSRADISEGDRLNGSNPITMSQVVAGDKPSKNVSEVEATPTGEHGDQVYYNTLQAPYKTSIAVDELNNFLRTHDKQYFEEQFKKIPTTCNAPMSIGMGPENKHKNRYKNICTYDHSRVLLTADAEKKLGDYINASYVQGYKSDEKFIASQGPNKVILDDFVRMLWEHKTDKVVMLTNLVEEGKHKCEKYWPETDEVQFGEIRVRLITTQVFADYTIRRLQLMKVGHPTHSLTQFHFTSWPDKGVPSLPWPLVDFEQRVASFPTSEPIVVHCSAGVGRTGTFIGLRNVMREAEETGTMDFYTTLWKLRQDRVYMIQTVEQYIFLHHAAQVAMVCIGTTVTIDDIRDRIDVLNRVSGLAGETNLDKEFKAVCRVCDDGDGVKDDESSRDNFSDTYMNSRTASNKFKNRFSNVLPKDLYRPYLSCETRDLSDYINAVLLPSFVKQNQQILTQLPLPTTVLDFWRLVTQFKVSLVVAFETDLEDLTCGKYLPEENAPLQTGSFDVEIQPLTRDDSWEMANLCVTIHRKRKPRLSTSSAHTEEHCLKHVKCSVSDLNIEKLLNIVNQVRSCRQGNGKIVYMCRNGADFSGLVCVLTLLLDRMDNDHRLTVPLVVGAIKAIRPQVIPTVEQYRMLYDVLQLYHDSSVYCNFGDAKSKSDQSHGKSNEAFNGDENVYANS